MPTVRFTDNIQRHVECPTRVVEGTRVSDVLEAYFATNTRARSYVLDDQGRLREHMSIFISGEQLRDRVRLTDPVPLTAFWTSFRRSHDGGKTFETLARGLPQEHAYDLDYRHALDIDDSGEQLAFGSTTGSLWVSENGGDAWQTVSLNLPPIHAVRFEMAG
jgi:hypothetical protein